MRRASILAALGVTLALLCSLAIRHWAPRERPVDQQASNAGPSLTADLTGKWMQLTRTVNGEVMDEPPGVFLVVTDDGRMEHHVANGSTWLSGSTIVGNQFFRLDGNRGFATIDKSGRPDWTEVTRGICRLEGDVLTLCFAPKNQPRPTAFATGDAEGAGSVLMVFERSP